MKLGLEYECLVIREMIAYKCLGVSLNLSTRTKSSKMAEKEKTAARGEGGVMDLVTSGAPFRLDRHLAEENLNLFHLLAVCEECLWVGHQCP